MDARAMSVVGSVGWLFGGGGVGALHFALLRWNVRALVGSPASPRTLHNGRGADGRVKPGHDGGSGAAGVIAAPLARHGGTSDALAAPLVRDGGTACATSRLLPLLRLPLTAGLLFAAARHGAMPLLLMGTGILASRPLMLRWA